MLRQSRVWGAPFISPFARSGFDLVFDSSRNRVVLFGGYTFAAPSGPKQDTWEFTGNTWVDMNPSGSKPASRSQYAFSYDVANSKTVIFGGGGAGLFSDTWTWNGTVWTDVTPVTRPSARSYVSMAYHAGTARSILFGGTTGSAQNDTWSFNGATNTWTNVTPGTNPSVRDSHCMAPDVNGNVILFGGRSGATTLGDTWSWNGSSWTNVTPGTSPSTRFVTAMAYDSARGKTVLFGGYRGTPTNAAVGETWEWNGSSWTNVTPGGTSPAARAEHGMAYDPVRGKVVLFGGDNGITTDFGDTWEWDGTLWTQRA